jgi:hypothetical protein
MTPGVVAGGPERSLLLPLLLETEKDVAAVPGSDNNTGVVEMLVVELALIILWLRVVAGSIITVVGSDTADTTETAPGRLAGWWGPAAIAFSKLIAAEEGVVVVVVVVVVAAVGSAAETTLLLRTEEKAAAVGSTDTAPGRLAGVNPAGWAVTAAQGSATDMVAAL